MKSGTFSAFFAALLILAQFGCTSEEPYRVDHPIIYVPTAAKTPVTMGFVEVDDQGELQSFDQLRAVGDQIKAQSKKRHLNLVLFVHGWNNNASENAANVKSFQRSLKSLAEAHGQWGGERIFGVYVGWRGRTLNSSPVFGDFYNRYQGGQRVGTGAGTDAIFEIAATAREANKRNKIILVGHSFGGLVLEHAVSQPVRARLAEMHASAMTKIQSRELIPADLVVLINQAQPAVRARTLVSALRDRRIWTADDDLPWIVSVTSESDTATGWWFPRGVEVGRMFPVSLFNTSVSGRYRKQGLPPEAGTQKEAAKRTAGHFAPLHSHRVEFVSPDIEPSQTIGKRNVNVEMEPQLWHVVANLKPLQTDGRMLVRTDKGVYQIARKPEANTFNRTPYWIMAVPKEIIADHNDIWTDRVTGLVVALMNLRNAESVKNAPPPPVPPALSTAEPRVELQLNTL